MAAEQAILPNELTPIQRILGNAASYAPDTIAAADKYHIEAPLLAELVTIEITKLERMHKDDAAKLSQLLAANNIQMLIQGTATQIATEETRQAVEIMGGDPSKVTSPNLPRDFKIPDYIIRSHPNQTNGNTLYDFAAKFKGTHYIWGGTNLEHGCDCSGFVMGVFKQFGVNLDHSSQLQAKEIAKAAGTSATLRETSCQKVNADQIPDNAVMTMGPKNGIGHVVIVTTKPDGSRVVMQSMGGGVGVCEMPLEKFVDYLHRQPAGRTLQVADYDPLVQNRFTANLSTQPSDPRGQHVEHATVAPSKTGRVDLAHIIAPSPHTPALAVINPAPAPAAAPGAI